MLSLCLLKKKVLSKRLLQNQRSVSRNVAWDPLSPVLGVTNGYVVGPTEVGRLLV